MVQVAKVLRSQIRLQLPEDFVVRVKALAARNQREFVREWVRAMERHLESPEFVLKDLRKCVRPYTRPDVPRAGMQVTFVVDPMLEVRIRHLAIENARTLRDEVVMAMCRHLEHPEIVTVTVETPPLPPVTVVEVPAPKKKKRVDRMPKRGAKKKSPRRSAKKE